MSHRATRIDIAPVGSNLKFMIAVDGRVQELEGQVWSLAPRPKGHRVSRWVNVDGALFLVARAEKDSFMDYAFRVPPGAFYSCKNRAFGQIIHEMKHAQKKLERTIGDSTGM